MSKKSVIGEEDLNILERRLGSDTFHRRRLLEKALLRQKKPQRRGRRWASKTFLLEYVLRSLGLWERGFRNYLDPHLVEHEVYLSALPPAFEGFRLLQLSDLHCTLAEGFLEALLSKLKGIACDAVLLTGDYCARVGCHHDLVLRDMESILAALPLPRWGVLGNYDLLELVPRLENQKLRILLNEWDKIERGDESLFFCGVDDPALFRTSNLERARRGISREACTILLAHSPEVWQKAATLGYSLMLSGHTHGGQICFPGGRPVLRRTQIPRDLMRGEWRKGSLTGYTSPGTGVSQLSVRFNCPGEITIHILRRL